MRKSEYIEGLEISKRLMAELMTFPVEAGGAGAALRSAVGAFLADLHKHVYNHVVGTELYACFELARAAGATLNSMDRARVAMFAEAPLYPMGEAIVNAAIIFSFVEQSQIISNTTFAARSEAAVVMDAMAIVIEDIKLTKADSFVSSDYQKFIGLAALLIQHLAATERLLPRIVAYRMAINYPALALSNRIYGDGSRSDELVAENETVHPAFMQRDVIALSE